MEDLNILALPDGYMYVVLAPADEGGFNVAMYNKISPANMEIICMARGMIELLSTSTEGVLMVGQSAVNKDNTIDGEAEEIFEDGEQKLLTKDADLKDIEPLGHA